jgi:hypothetical protein
MMLDLEPTAYCTGAVAFRQVVFFLMINFLFFNFMIKKLDCNKEKQSDKLKVKGKKLPSEGITTSPW